jgi:short-subunit dehydrogenase
MDNIVITGASRGIGRAIAEHCLAHDYQVFGLARYRQTAPIAHPHYHAQTIDFAQIDTLVTQLTPFVQTIAPPAAIVCAAGYGQFGGIEQFSVAQMQRLLNVNFLSQAIVIKTLLPMMKQAERGKIIFIGSEAALSGEKQGSLYCASKFALRGFSQSLRKECASAGIAVTLINPGMTNTQFFDELMFKPKDPHKHALQTQHITQAVDAVLVADANCVWEEINLQPLTKAIVKRHAD